MNDDTLKSVIADVLRIPESEISAATTKDNVETWDSLRHMDLIGRLEDELAITLTAEEIVSMVSFGAIEKVLNQRGVG